MSTCWLRAIFFGVVDQLATRYWRLISRIDRNHVLPRLREYSDAVRDETGGLILRVVCFLDGKFIATCRPLQQISLDYQRSVYNGYYRGHGKRAMHLVFPDGIIIASVGSVRRSDQFLRERDDLEPQVNSLFIPSATHPLGDPNAAAYCWSDTAYSRSGHFERASLGALRLVLTQKPAWGPLASVWSILSQESSRFSPSLISKKNCALQAVTWTTCG